MAENQPPRVVLKDLESIAKEFVIAHPFKFTLKEFPDKQFEILVKPLTQAQLAEARQLGFISPPKKKKKDDSGNEVSTDEDDWLDPDFQIAFQTGAALRRAYIFTRSLPDIKFCDGEPSGDDLKKVVKEIQEKFPEPYSNIIEAEILRQSTNELAIINLANFSASDGSAQS